MSLPKPTKLRPTCRRGRRTTLAVFTVVLLRHYPDEGDREHAHTHTHAHPRNPGSCFQFFPRQIPPLPRFQAPPGPCGRAQGHAHPRLPPRAPSGPRRAPGARPAWALLHRHHGLLTSMSLVSAPPHGFPPGNKSSRRTSRRGLPLGTWGKSRKKETSCNGNTLQNPLPDAS